MGTLKWAVPNLTDEGHFQLSSDLVKAAPDLQDLCLYSHEINLQKKLTAFVTAYVGREACSARNNHGPIHHVYEVLDLPLMVDRTQLQCALIDGPQGGSLKEELCRLDGKNGPK